MPLVINVLAKFEVSSSNLSRDIEGSQNFKSRSRNPFPTPFDPILHFLLVPLWSICIPNLKFLATTVPEIWGVPKIQKVGHVTPSQPVNRGRRWLHISSPRPRFVYSLYNFHGATMTIKGSSLQVSIPIVKAFLTQNFCPVQKFTPNCCFLFLGNGIEI